MCGRGITIYMAACRKQLDEAQQRFSPRTMHWQTKAAAGAAAEYKNETRSMRCVMGNDLLTIQSVIRLWSKRTDGCKSETVP